MPEAVSATTFTPQRHQN